MKYPISYTLYRNDEEHNITISPVTKVIPGGELYATGVFRLSKGTESMGDIVFDDNMNQWEYTGMGDLTHEEAAEIAAFIQNYREPDAINNNV